MNLLKISTLFLCLSVAGCGALQTSDGKQPGDKAQSSSAKRWWPFAEKAEGQPSAADSQSGMAWLDQHEKPLRDAVAGSDITVERRDNALVLIVPVDSSFNPKRPEMLLPAVINPIGRAAKLAQADPQGGVLVVGHTDSSGSKAVNDKLSIDRARAVASIFRLSGMEGNRLRLKGVGADLPRADNSTATGRALNRRVEVLWALRGVLPTLAQSNVAP
ncbi:putative lipoprotein YiaD precursor [compost metagenome]